MPELRLEIPGVPPSGNHYKSYRVIKNFVTWYLTAEAKAWFRDVATIARGQRLVADAYTLSYIVFTRTARSSDVDNFAKVIADSLQHAGVITNDKHVTDLHGYRRIDRQNPRTVIVVRTEQEQLFGGKQ